MTWTGRARGLLASSGYWGAATLVVLVFGLGTVMVHRAGTAPEAAYLGGLIYGLILRSWVGIALEGVR